LERAKEYLAIAESEDSKRGAYLAAAAEIKAEKDDGMTWTQIDTVLGRGDSYGRRLVRWAYPGAGAPPIAGTLPFTEPGSRRVTRDGARNMLTDPERRREALGQLTPEERGELVAEQLADPAVAENAMRASSPDALRNVDTAAGTESYMRRRQAAPPPADAASHQLGGVGPQETADQIHANALEPRIDRVLSALASLKTHVGIRGANLALTDVSEFDELDRQVQEMSELFAFMLDAIDGAKAAKLANEAEGQARTT
jgi:hypothetical protein